jgi:hypothetical protein
MAGSESAFSMPTRMLAIERESVREGVGGHEQCVAARWQECASHHPLCRAAVEVTLATPLV